jgi:hypothetical protein
VWEELVRTCRGTLHPTVNSTALPMSVRAKARRAVSCYSCQKHTVQHALPPVPERGDQGGPTESSRTSLCTAHAAPPCRSSIYTHAHPTRTRSSDVTHLLSPSSNLHFRSQIQRCSLSSGGRRPGSRAGGADRLAGDVRPVLPHPD